MLLKKQFHPILEDSKNFCYKIRLTKSPTFLRSVQNAVDII